MTTQKLILRLYLKITNRHRADIEKALILFCQPSNDRGFDTGDQQTSLFGLQPSEHV